jgi:hypothetical protein
MSLNLPGLNFLERWAVYLLVRSPRTSLVVVKERHWPQIFVAADQTDPVAAFIVKNPTAEPLSMQLERIYHQPSYGEPE